MHSHNCVGQTDQRRRCAVIGVCLSSVLLGNAMAHMVLELGTAVHTFLCVDRLADDSGI